MKSTSVFLFATMVAVSAAIASPAQAETVKVTPLGGQDGEFCRFDRALILEDPDGTRLLYDAGRTVAGPGDPRLGEIDALLVSHLHGDHIGDRHIAEVNAGSCTKPDFSVIATPESNTVKIALAKEAKIVSGSEMPSFFASKLKAAGGDPKDAVLVRFGASAKIGGVTVTTVPAAHSNGLDSAFIGGTLGGEMKAAGITAYAGPPTGFVLTFTNGLVVYLSGDTGITAEQDRVVRGYYRAKLVVMNIGDTFTTGPAEAAYVVNELIKPNEVIASHANEEATRGGMVLPGTRTEAFINATRVPVVVPLSGRTMAFGPSGKCDSGC